MFTATFDECTRPKKFISEGRVVLKMEVLLMCDVKKYNEIYKDIVSLQPEDTLQLVLEAETEEEKIFYELIGDFLLQMKQKQVIESNLF